MEDRDGRSAAAATSQLPLAKPFQCCRFACSCRATFAVTRISTICGTLPGYRSGQIRHASFAHQSQTLHTIAAARFYFFAASALAYDLQARPWWFIDLQIHGASSERFFFVGAVVVPHRWNRRLPKSSPCTRTARQSTHRQSLFLSCPTSLTAWGARFAFHARRVIPRANQKTSLAMLPIYAHFTAASSSIMAICDAQAVMSNKAALSQSFGLQTGAPYPRAMRSNCVRNVTVRSTKTTFMAAMAE